MGGQAALGWLAHARLVNALVVGALATLSGMSTLVAEGRACTGQVACTAAQLLTLRCVDMLHAASKMPPGGAVGTSALMVTTSKGLAFGFLRALSWSITISTPTLPSRSRPRAAHDPRMRSTTFVPSPGAQKAMSATAIAAKICDALLRGIAGNASAPFVSLSLSPMTVTEWV